MIYLLLLIFNLSVNGIKTHIYLAESNQSINTSTQQSTQLSEQINNLPKEYVTQTISELIKSILNKPNINIKIKLIDDYYANSRKYTLILFLFVMIFHFSYNKP